jgi:thiol:disulfide interchange protein
MALGAAAICAASGIHWQTDFKKAQALAKKRHVPMVVDFYADW